MVGTPKLKTVRIDDSLEGQVRVLAAQVHTAAARTAVRDAHVAPVRPVRVDSHMATRQEEYGGRSRTLRA